MRYVHQAHASKPAIKQDKERQQQQHPGSSGQLEVGHKAVDKPGTECLVQAVESN